MKTTENRQNDKQFWGMDEKNYSMLMHLSQFGGFIVPLAGLIMPIVMWLTNNKESETIDAHGKNIINWMISSVIYAIISAVLIFIYVGIGLLIILVIIEIIFPIVGGIKANRGEVWKYPLAIRFFK